MAMARALAGEEYEELDVCASLCVQLAQQTRQRQVFQCLDSKVGKLTNVS